MYSLDKQETKRYFRNVLKQTDRFQLVAQHLKPGQELGTETHDDMDQLFFIVDGSATAPWSLGVGDVLVVPAGTQHNVRAGAQGLCFWTVYVAHVLGKFEHQLGERDIRADLQEAYEKLHGTSYAASIGDLMQRLETEGDHPMLVDAAQRWLEFAHIEKRSKMRKPKTKKSPSRGRSPLKRKSKSPGKKGVFRKSKSKDKSGSPSKKKDKSKSRDRSKTKKDGSPKKLKKEKKEKKWPKSKREVSPPPISPPTSTFGGGGGGGSSWARQVGYTPPSSSSGVRQVGYTPPSGPSLPREVGFTPSSGPTLPRQVSFTPSSSASSSPRSYSPSPVSSPRPSGITTRTSGGGTVVSGTQRTVIDQSEKISLEGEIHINHYPW